MTVPDEVAEPLAAVATELMCRVRDDDPEANVRWLRSQVQPEQYEALILILAAAIPTDRTWAQLTSWTWLRGLSSAPVDTELSTGRGARIHRAGSSRAYAHG
jgi:hypothetical protein